MNKVTVEFFRSNGSPVNLIDLSPEFLSSNGISNENAARPFRIGMQPKVSKAGNEFFEYAQNSIPLPDGLQTYVKVNGTLVPMGSVKPSKSGNPTRDGSNSILIGNVVHDVVAYLTEAKSGFYVKVFVHKQPDRSKNIKKAQMAPRGGQFL